MCRRFADDIAVFSRRDEEQGTGSGAGATNADDELDFFGDSAVSAGAAGSAAGERGSKSDGEGDECHDQDDSGDEIAASDTKKAAENPRAVRKSMGIRVQGADPPDPATSFSALAEAYRVPKYLIRNLTTPKPEGFGFESPTPVQAQAIPCLLAGRDVLAVAPTGSGKTVAFALPLLYALIAPKKEGVRALVLTPTAELGQQLKRQISKLCRGRAFRTLMLAKPNANAETFGSTKRRDILIATPLRLIRLVRENIINLSGVVYLALDEADRLFEEGFIEQIDEVLAACPNPKIQRTLFSATMPHGVEVLARTVLRNPVRVVVGLKNAAAAEISQKLVFVGDESGKPIAMRQLIQKGLKVPVLCFVQSVERAKQLFHELVYEGVRVDVIHSQRSASQRDRVVQAFRTGRIWVLIATDLMARGVDFRGVNCVINYDVPQTKVNYIHRIGRTGRAGRKGVAITFFTEKDAKLIRGIAQVVRRSGGEVPDWMLTGIAKPTKKEKRRFVDEAPNRQRISFTYAQDQIDRRKRKKKKKKKKHASETDTAADADRNPKKSKKRRQRDESAGSEGKRASSGENLAGKPRKAKKKKNRKS